MKFSYFIFLFIILLSGIQINAKQLEVCSTCTYKTLKSALGAANDGDKIIVRGGTYKEGNIVISKAIQLIGIDFRILDCENKTEIITVRSTNDTDEGYHIHIYGSRYVYDWDGLLLHRPHHITTRN